MGIAFAERTLKHIEGCGWSYSGFMEFRKKLAKEIGIDLEAMDGFVANGISWGTVVSPIGALLNHSDCEGALDYNDCEQIYPELLKLIDKWPDGDYDKINGKALAEAMKTCASEGHYLEFC